MQVVSPKAHKISQAALLAKFKTVRQASIDICSPLEAEDYVIQPREDTSPPKWHLGHTTWFFEEFLLKPNASDYSIFHEDTSYLFNSYYEAVGKRVLRSERGNMSRPSVSTVLAYRNHVNEAMYHWMSEVALSEDLLAVLQLGLQHEQQHQELLRTDIKYILGHNPLFPVYKEENIEHRLSCGSKGSIRIDEGVYDVGHQGEAFHFDNELGRHKVYIAASEVDSALISNGAYLEFLESGGYQAFQHWLSEGWEWIKQGHTKPLYWHKIDGRWHEYTLAGLKILDLEAPVKHISYFEASAFAHWSSKRLLTEFEREILSDRLPCNQLWEWTQSAYLPYPNFKEAPGAIGEYNGKFMINQMVLRGGSIATPEGHWRPSYRNFWHTHHQFQYTGIRLAKTL